MKKKSTNNNAEDDFDDWEDEEEKNTEKYWFTKDKVEKIRKIHENTGFPRDLWT